MPPKSSGKRTADVSVDAKSDSSPGVGGSSGPAAQRAAISLVTAGAPPPKKTTKTGHGGARANAGNISNVKRKEREEALEKEREGNDEIWKRFSTSGTIRAPAAQTLDHAELNATSINPALESAAESGASMEASSAPPSSAIKATVSGRQARQVDINQGLGPADESLIASEARFSVPDIRAAAGFEQAPVPDPGPDPDDVFLENGEEREDEDFSDDEDACAVYLPRAERQEANEHGSEEEEAEEEDLDEPVPAESNTPISAEGRKAARNKRRKELEEKSRRRPVAMVSLETGRSSSLRRC